MPKRRSPGEGAIYEVRTGKHAGTFASAVQISAPGEPRQRKVYRGRSREEVRQKLLAAQRAGVGPTTRGPTRDTVEALIEERIRDRASRVKPRTIRQYRDIARLHIYPHVGKRPVHSFGPEQVDALLDRLERDGRSPDVRRLVRTIIGGAYKMAVRRRRAFSNPVDAVDPIRRARKRMQVWSAEEAARFIRNAAGDPFRHLYVLALTIGMRQGELLALRWSDVDFPNRAISVQETADEKDAFGRSGRVVTGEAKTDGSIRRIDLPAIALEALRAQLSKTKDLRSEFVFPNERGGAFAARNLRERHFKPLRDRCACGHGEHAGRCAACDCRKYQADLPRVRFHDLRHTYATIALANGVELKVVSETLGHSTPEFTARVYQHVLPTMQKRAARTVDDIYRKALASAR